MRRLLLSPLVVLATLVGCGSDSSDRAGAGAGDTATRVTDVSTVLPLRAAFNDDRGKPRLLLILSPT